MADQKSGGGQAGRLRSGGLLGSLIASAMLLGSRLGGVALTLAYTVLIARLMSPAEVGMVASLNSGMIFAAALVTLNYEAGVSRHLVQAIEAGDRAAINGFLRTGRLILVISAPLVAVGHYFIMRALNPAIPPIALMMTSLAIPVLASLVYYGRAVSQLGLPMRSQFANLFARPLLLLGLVSTAPLVLGVISPEVVAMALLISSILAWAIQRLLLARNGVLPQIDGKGDMSQARGWIATGAYLSPRMLIEQYLPDAVIFAASAALPHSQVALLMITMRCVNIIRFGIVSVEMALTPKLVRAEARKEDAVRDRILTLGGHMRFWPVLAACLIVCAVAPWLLGLFGPAYVEGANALRLSLITPLSLAMFGPSYVLLTARGYARSVGVIALAGIVSLFVLVPLASGAAGLLGASGAASAIAFSMSCAYWLVLKLRTGIDSSIFGATARLLARRRKA